MSNEYDLHSLERVEQKTSCGATKKTRIAKNANVILVLLNFMEKRKKLIDGELVAG